MATTEEYAQKNKYPHSLFVADYAVTNDVSWDALNTADLILKRLCQRRRGLYPARTVCGK